MTYYDKEKRKTEKMDNLYTEQTQRDGLEYSKGNSLLDNKFVEIFKDTKCADLLLRVILNRDDFRATNIYTVPECSTQILILAVDENNRKHLVLVQKDNPDVDEREDEYMGELMDKLKTGTENNEETFSEDYMIILTERDVFGKNFQFII